MVVDGWTCSDRSRTPGRAAADRGNWLERAVANRGNWPEMITSYRGIGQQQIAGSWLLGFSVTDSRGLKRVQGCVCEYCGDLFVL